MPSATPEIPPYSYVPETKEHLDWADLANIDLSKYGTKDGNAELAQVLINAIRSKGFFYVTNFDIAQSAIDKQFALGNAFYNLPLEEKLKYMPDLDAGEYNGYRPGGRRVLSGGIKEKTEVWNMATDNGEITQPVPMLLKSYIEEITSFAKDLHKKVLDPLYHLTAIALEIPEDYLVNLHKWGTHNESHLRYMKYGKFSPEEIEKLEDGLWSRGHTDLGSYTLLFRQPVAGLQIKDNETGSWKWARPLDGSLTVNACDALSFLTGGYIKSTVHRVSVPPKDQRYVDRLGLLYFSRAVNDLKLGTIDSPVLKREGCTNNEFEAGGHPVPTMGEFTRLKQTWQQSKKRGITYDELEGPQILPGFHGRSFK
ncbi:related to gibberellin 20-oxidase [Fusarium torulosum]|uniref:Related to gibberellin 20-oxidase n=1 Tax=Fusarium torulosum TaxID=33205 RepID=A0AAE8M1R7_9HYPO|nr:related to gibberellin 20-oxidase [Fusarium torulosum]